MANIETVRNWSGAQTLLGKRDHKTIGHNTILWRNPIGDFYVTLHGHLIAHFNKDGSILYSNAGWPTVTTRNRLNQIGFANVVFFQKKGVQYVHVGPIGPNFWTEGETRELDRSVTLYDDGNGNARF